MNPGAVLAQAGSCARQVASNESLFEAISEWQLAYLQKSLAA